MQKFVKIDLLKIMILGNDAANEANKFVRIGNPIILHIDQSYLVIQFIHMFCALIQIYNIAGYTLYLSIHFI